MLLIVGGCIAGFLFVECILRIISYSSPNFYRSDFYAGTALWEGAKDWWRKEGEACVTINSEGQQDREHIKKKPDGTFRMRSQATLMRKRCKFR